mmetsp:Transcript_23809/g.40610  ORF Transcript_23809/g.40610 Transcript_23809/m.40610 type:complete len:515 (+) Transcript_23809:192-1736(+)
MTKLSIALSFLLAANASASLSTSDGTTQNWYAASQARALMHRILQTKTTNAVAYNEESTSSSRQLVDKSTYSNLNSARKSRSFNKLQKHQPLSPMEILETLSKYDKFWIEIKADDSSNRSGPCVWSECALDDVDDEYTGDNRDGDSQWYQFRTQQFCANAAYSLYGRKKGDALGTFGDCTGRHFINSFFTYGGSDKLLKAIGTTPQVFYGGDSNADCVAANNGDAAYSTLGCAANGEFIMGYFDGNSCDGNYFVGGDNSFSKYNSAFNSVKCHEMDVVNDSYKLTTLIENSWACDVRTFGVSCPDPFQRKGYYEYALQTAANGGNPIRAYNHLLWKDELRLFSWVLLTISGLIFFAAFSIKQCAIKKKPEMPTGESYDEHISPTASAMTVGNTQFELEDGGKLKNIMERVSNKTLNTAAWLQWKVGRGEKPEPERTFQANSPEKKNANAEGYKSPEGKIEPVAIQLTRSTTPSTARQGLNMCNTDESALEMAPTSPQEDKPWVTMNKAPRQSLQ